MDKLRRTLTGDESYDEDSSTGIFSDLDSVVTLNWRTRIYAFIFCFVFGVFLSFLGWLTLFLHKGLTTFGVIYTLGNIVSIASSCFLMGPFKQIKKMFASTRIVATIMVIVTFILTIIAATVLKNIGLCLLFIILQWIATAWYSLSYVPYARDIVQKTVTSCI